MPTGLARIWRSAPTMVPHNREVAIPCQVKGSKSNKLAIKPMSSVIMSSLMIYIKDWSQTAIYQTQLQLI
jgi:hypothetical protein